MTTRAMYHLEWTDQAGTIHLWMVGTGETLCGRRVDLHTETPPQQLCECCVPVTIPAPSVVKD